MGVEDSLSILNCENPQEFVSNPIISNDILKSIAGTKGWPDWKDECVEEKGPKPDYLSVVQWARAILEYREGRPYQVAWRISRESSKLFETIFDFYRWQQS